MVNEQKIVKNILNSLDTFKSLEPSKDFSFQKFF